MINSLPLVILSPGYYKLSQDLAYYRPDFAITVKADDVEIDLNGYELTANSGISIEADNVKIYNGTMIGKNIGIKINNSEYTEVKDIVLSGFFTGIIADASGINIINTHILDDIIPITKLPYVIAKPGKYILTKDLIYDGNQAAINIIVNNVELDFNNHQISLAAGYGIECSFVENVKICNGQINGLDFGVGIHALRGQDLIIESMKFEDLVDNIRFEECSKVTLRESPKPRIKFDDLVEFSDDDDNSIEFFIDDDNSIDIDDDTLSKKRSRESDDIEELPNKRFKPNSRKRANDYQNINLPTKRVKR